MSPRILCFEPSYYPRLGGGEKLGHRFNAAFAAGGAGVRVLTAVPPLDERREIDGVDVEYLPAWRWLGFPWFGAARVARAVRELRPSFAVLYGPSPYDVVASLLLRALGVPYAAVYLADFDERRLPTRLATALHNAIVLRGARAIACITDRMAQRLTARGFGARTIVAHPGVDDAFFATPDGDGRDLLFVGALDDGHRYKRLDLLFAALARLDGDLRLRVVGDGDRRAEAEGWARDAGVAGRVAFLGALDDASLAREYATAGVLVLPSPTTQEGFGLVCLEAMAGGAPVVCSVNAGAAAIVAAASGCAVWNATDIEDLVRAIERARGATPADRAALRAYARRFGWRPAADALLAGFSRLIGPSRAE